MIYLTIILVFIVGLFLGFLVSLFLLFSYYEEKFFKEFLRFENRVDFSFEKYFGFPLFPDDKK